MKLNYTGFCLEVLESIQRAFTDNVDLDNLAVEIHGSRTANFMYFDDVPNAVMKGIVGVPARVHENFEQLPLKAQWEATSAVMVKFKKLMPQYVKTEKAQKTVLQALEVLLYFLMLLNYGSRYHSILFLNFIL